MSTRDELYIRKFRTIFISSIHPELNERDLIQLFGKFGIISNILLKEDRDPTKKKKKAMIEYTRDTDASASLKLDGTLLKTYYIKVQLSTQAIAQEPPIWLVSIDLYNI